MGTSQHTQLGKKVWGVGSEWHRCWNTKGMITEVRVEKSELGRGQRGEGRKREKERGVIMRHISEISCLIVSNLLWVWSLNLSGPRFSKTKWRWRKLNCVSTSQWGRYCSLKGILEICGGVLWCLIVCRAGSTVSGEFCQTMNCLVSFITLEWHGWQSWRMSY